MKKYINIFALSILFMIFMGCSMKSIDSEAPQKVYIEYSFQTNITIQVYTVEMKKKNNSLYPIHYLRINKSYNYVDLDNDYIITKINIDNSNKHDYYILINGERVFEGSDNNIIIYQKKIDEPKTVHNNIQLFKGTFKNNKTSNIPIFDFNINYVITTTKGGDKVEKLRH